MPAKSIAQRDSAKQEVQRRRMGDEEYKFRGIPTEDLEEIANTPDEDLPDRLG